MRIRFDYHNKRRSGELVALYTAGNGEHIAKVLEDGAEHPKSFSASRMGRVESGPRLAEAELLPLLYEAARQLDLKGRYAGHPLQLLLGAAFIAVPSEAQDNAEEAVLAFGKDLRDGTTDGVKR